MVVLVERRQWRGLSILRSSNDPAGFGSRPTRRHIPERRGTRVMYVAMTRARRTLTILASNARPFRPLVKRTFKGPGKWAQPSGSDQEVSSNVANAVDGLLRCCQGQDGRNLNRSRQFRALRPFFYAACCGMWVPGPRTGRGYATIQSAVRRKCT